METSPRRAGQARRSRALGLWELTGRQWLVVLALSLVTPLAVGIDKAIQLHRQNKAPAGAGEAQPSAGQISPARGADPAVRRRQG